MSEPWTLALLKAQLARWRTDGWEPMTLLVRYDELGDLAPLAAECGMEIKGLRMYQHHLNPGEISCVFMLPWVKRELGI